MGCATSQATAVASAAERVDTADVMQAGTHTGLDIEECLTSEEAEQSFHNDYVLSPKIGCGKFSQVRGITSRSGVTKQTEAVKIVNLRLSGEQVTSPHLQSIAKQEVDIWKALGEHPNCLRMHKHFAGSDFCYMVMEKCEMSLLQALDKMPESDYTERGLGNVTAQMLRGISHIHSVCVIHRDIKPDNVLVGGQDRHTVKLIDFGLAVIVPKFGKASGVFGTAPYMCPEMIREELYDTKADVWSLGVMLYVFLFGAFPYESTGCPSPQAMKEAIVVGAPPPYLPSLKFDGSKNGHLRTRDAVKLVKALLDRNPMSRLPADKALREHWITSSLAGKHRPGADLPSLRPMLKSATLAGAFEFLDVSKPSSADILLDQKQEEHDPLSPKFKPRNAPNKEVWENISSLSTTCDDNSNLVPASSMQTSCWKLRLIDDEEKTVRCVTVSSI